MSGEKGLSNGARLQRMRKGLLWLTHGIFLLLFVVGISLLYCNENFKKGFFWMNSEKYENSPAFMEQLESDINMIFDYTALQMVFETEGVFDARTNIFGIHMGNQDVNFSVEDVVAYAKRHGYYIDENYQAKVVDEAAASEIDNTPYRVLYRAYMGDAQTTEPGQANMTMKALVEESLDRLGRYYRGYQRLVLNPSNLKYKLDYVDAVYTNESGLNRDSAKALGKYAISRSEEIMIDNNLPRTPERLNFLSEQLATRFEDEYTVIIAVDTAYPVEDVYFTGNMDYRRQRSLYFAGFVLTALGLAGLLFTLGLLIYHMLKEDPPEKPGRFFVFLQKIPVEVKLLLYLFSMLFLGFLNKNLGIKLMHVLLPAPYWQFESRMMVYVIVYVCSLVTGFGLLRELALGLLWKHSYLKRMHENFQTYGVRQTLARRWVLIFFTVFLTNGALVAFVVFQILMGRSLLSHLQGITAFCALLVLNLFVFNKMYGVSLESDKIAEAIRHIAKGNTDYQLNEGEFTGKEADIVKSINNIRIGFHTAINDQVKSERLKADLITNVSHDIKTPLTSIINYVDLIKREKPENPRIQEYLEVLSVKSQHLKNLTEDLVEASKASSGNISVDLRDIDLVEMIHQTNGEFEEKLEKKGLTVVSRFPEGSLMIRADGRHLWRVLENLYNNVFKYALTGSRIYVDVKREEGKGVFIMKNVSEKALNIGPEELTERFVRGDESRATEGSGLGLSIAKSLTVVQGGSFEIRIDGDLFKVILSFQLQEGEQDAVL